MMSWASVCAVVIGVFFVVCVLHRVLNKPSEAIGVASIDCNLVHVIFLLIVYVVLNSALPIILLRGLTYCALFDKNNHPPSDVIINLFTQTLILLTYFPVLKRVFLIFCSRHNRSIGSVLCDSLYRLGTTIPLLMVCLICWVQVLLFLKSHGIIDDIVQQDIVATLFRIDNVRDLIFFTLTACAIVPVTEELIFRGFLYRFLKSRCKPLLANLVTAVIFAGLHGNMLAFVPLFVLSISLVWAYEQNNDIRDPICLHALFNLFNIVVCLWSLQINGTAA